jgi:hypothetical protein
VVGSRKENDHAAARKSREGGRHSLVDGIWALILPGIIIFGLKFGIFTPTEAAWCAPSMRCSSRCSSTASSSGSSSTRVRHGRQDDRDRHVPGRGGAGVVMADHRGRSSPRRSSTARAFMGNQLMLMIAMMVLVVIVGTALDMTPTILILTPC